MTRHATPREQAAALAASFARLRGKTDGCTLSPDFDFKECCDWHDVRYRENPERITRAEADRALRVCIRGKGYVVLPWAYWGAVRLFGWAFWRRSRAAEDEAEGW